MKAESLIRVSTEEQKEAGNSLPAQQARLRDYIVRNPKLTLDKEFIFDESAYKEHRKRFQKVIDYIRSQKEIVALCCDKVDRLSRDFLIGLPELEKLRREGKIELHFPSDNLILHKDSPATDLFHFNIAVSLAQYYSNCISDNVKRAYEHKIKNGEWIGRARIGYIWITKEDGTRDLVPDQERSLYIPKIYEYYLEGTSVKLLALRMKKEGLRNISGKPLSPSMIHHILKDKFYYGMMVIKGIEHPHKYQPLISLNTYLKVQEALKRWHKKPFRFVSKPCALRGLIHCHDAKCGCMITPEFKKNDLILYSCTNYRRIHNKRLYVSEDDLLKPIYKALEKLKMPQDRVDKIVEDLRATTEAQNVYHEKVIKSLDKQYLESQANIKKMFRAFINERITQDIYDENFKEEKELQADILIQKEEHMKADKEYHVTASTVFSLAKRALEIIKSSEPQEKRQFLGYLLQNCTLDGRNLHFSLRNPFNLIAEYSNHPTGLRIVNNVRTIFERQNEYIYIPDLRNFSNA